MRTTQQKKSEVSLSYESYLARVGKERIPCYEPSLGAEELRNVTDVLRRNWLSEGRYTREFEARLAKLCCRRYAVAFSNATAALIVGMKSAGLGMRDEVIVPSFAHSADPNAICAAGATPVFTDIDETTLCLSTKTVEAARTPRTKAVLFISAYGNTGDLREVERYAKKNRLLLIHDCAPALFGVLDDKPVPAYGDFSALSFFADKTITTGEGGMLLSDDRTLVNEANRYKHDGRKERGEDRIERRGYNFRITELQSALGVAQLKKAKRFVRRKREILKAYAERLSGIPEVRVFPFSRAARISLVPHRIIVFVPDAARLIQHLESLGIGARTLFSPMHAQPAYRVRGQFPATKKVFKTGVCLPSAPTLTRRDIQFVCDAMKNFYKTR